MINNLINFIETLKVSQILFAFGVYLLFLWLLVPIWVYLDSKKKFKNDLLSVLLFMLVLPLNIPGLLFYIIIRPEDDIYEDIDDDHVVNIPIVNFVSDKNDLVLGFEIKLNGNIIKDDMAKDINLKVDLDHANTVEFKQAVNAIKNEVEADAEGVKNIFSKYVSKIKTQFQSAAEEAKEEIDEIKEEVEERIEEVSKEESKKEDKKETKEGKGKEKAEDSDTAKKEESKESKNKSESSEVKKEKDEA